MQLKHLASGLLLTASLTAAAQTTGGISADMMREIQKSYQGTASDKAIQNAIANTNIKTLALSLDNKKEMDTYFSHRVVSKGVSDQESSGRCWLFTGLNILRAKMMAEYNLPDMMFSHNYLSFYDQLEKANLFLQGIINTREKPMEDQMVTWHFRNPLSDGGQFTGVSDLIDKYGLVPAGVMPETNSSNNTATMAQLVSTKLREYALDIRSNDFPTDAKAQEEAKTKMLATIYRMLVLNLGEPVTEFEWTRKDASGKAIETKKYTPHSFYNEFFGDKLTDKYVMVMNDPCREYYKVYEIDYDRHVYDGYNWTYLNLPIEEVSDIAIASIKDSTMMYFSCDVGKFLDAKRGLLDINNYDYASLMGTEFGMNKKERVQSFASGSSHAMTLMAVDLDENGKPKKWMVENSWGASHGYKGHLIMTDEWFQEYMFRLVFEKKYVPKKFLKLLEQEPIKLPSWDPMFAPEQ